MHFGIYHVEPCRHEAYFFESLSFDYMDTYIINYWWDEALCLRALKACTEAGKSAWVSVSGLLFDVASPADMVDVGDGDSSSFQPGARLKPDWQARIDRLMRVIREAGAWDGFAGLYMDEPLLWGVTLEQFKLVTGYPRTRYPDKGFFVCFSVAGVAPDVWTTGHVEPITPDAGQYLTDVSYDMYHKFDERYAYIASEMKRRLGNRKDLKIWYVPCTMDYRGDKTEEHCLEHLQGCTDLLLQEENPGGLFCFTYHTFSQDEEALGNVGLMDLTRPDYKKYWPRLQEAIEKTGRELLRSER